MDGSVTEISRRSMSHAEEGFYCGMNDILTVDAEIEASYQGSPVFFHAQWTDTMAERIFFEATKESVYALWKQSREANGNFGEIVELCRAREQDVVEPGPELADGFAPQYDALVEMVKDELRANGVSPATYKLFRK